MRVTDVLWFGIKALKDENVSESSHWCQKLGIRLALCLDRCGGHDGGLYGRSPEGEGGGGG